MDFTKKYPIKIKLDATGHGEILIGDTPLPYTRNVRFCGGVNEVPTVEVEILAIDGVEIETVAELKERYVDPFAERGATAELPDPIRRGIWPFMEAVKQHIREWERRRGGAA